MTTHELLDFQLDHALNQLRKALDGLDGTHVDGKPVNTAMSIRQIVVHLADVYNATAKHARGEEHEWGSTEVEAADWAGLVEETFRLREAALAEAKGMADQEDALKTIHDYLIAHDYYHVGQLVTIRLGVEPDWNSYAIYS